jgi:hypothetical protein
MPMIAECDGCGKRESGVVEYPEGFDFNIPEGWLVSGKEGKVLLVCSEACLLLVQAVHPEFSTDIRDAATDQIIKTVKAN